MPKRRVIAFTMHEHEQSAARSAMPTGEATEGFVTGELEVADIESLRALGLVVQELDTERAEAPPPVPFPHGFSVGDSVAATGDSSIHRLRLNGPMMPAWRAALEKLGVEILEAMPAFAIKVRIPRGNVHQVNQLPFIAGPAEVIGSVAAILPGFGPEAGFLPPREVAVHPFDVLLRDDQALAPFLDWLKTRQVTVGPARGKKVRLFVVEGSPLIDEIRSLVDWVDRIEEYVPPRLHNDVARLRLGLDLEESNPGVRSLLPFQGESEIVAIADTGIDDSHPDFAGRIVGKVALGRPGDTSDPNGHGTHVAGSVLGDGSASGGKVRGAAPGAKLFFQSLLDRDGGLEGLPFQLSELFEEAYRAGARIHNNSWGAATASSYRVTSSEVDDFVASHRDMLIVISAGNEGSSADPAIGKRNAAPGFVDWLSIGSPATSKNALTVGASRSGRVAGGFAANTYGELWPDDFPKAPIGTEKVSADSDAMGAFSSRGPCDDYRIKPDLVAPGTDILSCKSSRAPLRNFWGPDPINPRYAYMGGTSMAAPLVTGCAALVRQYYTSVRGHQPSAALLKGTLINGARWLKADDAVADYHDAPNYHQGFGCVFMPSTIPANDQAFALAFFDNWQDAASQFGHTGQRRRFQVRSAGGTLRLCLAYTDPPGRGLQNNLDLIVDVPGAGQKRFGNEKVPRGFNGPDPNNNVETLVIENGPPGDYLIQITATNILKPPQDFALVVTGPLLSALVPH